MATRHPGLIAVLSTLVIARLFDSADLQQSIGYRGLSSAGLFKVCELNILRVFFEQVILLSKLHIFTLLIISFIII